MLPLGASALGMVFIVKFLWRFLQVFFKFKEEQDKILVHVYQKKDVGVLGITIFFL